MLKDVQNGRNCEIDFINGIVCKQGEKVGVSMPLCQKIVEIVHGIEDGIHKIGYENVEKF